jgi:hypothetical protein
MASIVEDLQRAALNERESVSGLLRRTKLVAAKLGREETVAWAERELVGYSEDDESPPYREVKEKALARMASSGQVPKRFSPGDALLTFLEGL